MTRPRIYEVAKYLDIKSTELLDLLAGFSSEAKNHMSTLTDMDMNIILEHYTTLYDDGSDINIFLGSGAVKEEEKTAVKEEIKKVEEKPASPEEKVVKSSRHVDMRPSVVDLDKLDTEKVEKLAPVEIKDDVLNKQKIKKGPKRHDNRAAIDQLSKNLAKEKKKEKLEIQILDDITVGELAEKLEVPATEVIKRLMLIGVMATITQSIDFDTAVLVADDLDAIVTKEIIVTAEDRLFNDVEDKAEELEPRSPVVVVMGHVDHGKTSLLDAIRSANVAGGEAGGITQHIGAYRVSINDRKITFLDTPGHEAFTAMRARGAQVTDIAILVVAADDGIMPQTVEAINHAKAAGVNIIIAINKIDKEGANPDRVKQELTEYNLIPEEWGGETICVEVSAKQNINIDTLLEMVTLTADMMELKANPNRMAKGTVIESKLDKGRGPVATVLVQNGTLKQGDIVVAGTAVGKVRVMVDDKGKKILQAGPSIPVEIVGLSEAPDGGEVFYCVADERAAKNVVEARKQKIKDEGIKANAMISLEDLFAQIQQGEVKDLNIIVKADVQGSVEAVKQSLEKLSNEEVRVKVIHGGVGAIRETDVMLAAASNALIVGFNVRPDAGAAASAQAQKIDMRMYRIIYEAIEEIEAAMKGMLTPKFRESVIGHAEVRQTFKVTDVGTIAGSYVLDGKIARNSSVRVVRDGVVVFEGKLDSLRRFKDDAKEVATGYECGIGLDKFNDIKEGDIIEAYIMEEIKQ